MSALYGAAGVVHDAELTRALLEANASPDDGESLYHATEARSPDCLRVLLDHSAQTRDTAALAHALDYDRIEPVRLLLDAGADPLARSGAAFDTPLAWAALGSQNHRAPGRDYVAVAERLVAAGAQLEPRFAEVAEGPLAGWVSVQLRLG
jgi:ankyrin repeat protein